MPNIFFDFEFFNKTTASGMSVVQPLSVGLVSGQAKLYLEVEAPLEEIGAQDPWLAQNVIPYLGKDPSLVSTALHAGLIIEAWVEKHRGGFGARPTFWAYRAATDWQCMMGLFGGFLNMPHTWHKSCRDLGHLVDDHPELEAEWPEQVDGHHHALKDAEWNQELHRFFRGKRLV